MPYISLGTLTPQLGNWQSFPGDSVNGETFRFRAGNLQGKSGYPWFKTYCLVRFAWNDGAVINYTPSRRIYPRPEPIVMDFPIPADIKAAGGLVWTPQIIKMVYRRVGRTNEPAWTVTCEDFISSQ